MMRLLDIITEPDNTIIDMITRDEIEVEAVARFGPAFYKPGDPRHDMQTPVAFVAGAEWAIKKATTNRVEKFAVCVGCNDMDYSGQCDCFHGNYKTVTLEFNVCPCCDNRIDYPIDSEFNEKALDTSKQ